EFQGWRKRGEQPLVVAKERSRVEAVHAIGCHDPVRASNAIRTGNLFLPGVPGEQMEIRPVEAIEIQRMSSAFADRPIADFAKPANLPQDVRNPARLCDEHLKGAASGETIVRRQTLDLGLEEIRSCRLRASSGITAGGARGRGRLHRETLI